MSCGKPMLHLKSGPPLPRPFLPTAEQISLSFPGEAQQAVGPLLPASWCSPEWEGPRRSCPALKGHRFTNTAQLEPPSPALTSPCGLLTILHLIYQLYYNVVCIYDLILIWTISRSGEGADSLFFYFILLLWIKPNFVHMLSKHSTPSP